jgi:hypothetical protein
MGRCCAPAHARLCCCAFYASPHHEDNTSSVSSTSYKSQGQTSPAISLFEVACLDWAGVQPGTLRPRNMSTAIKRCLKLTHRFEIDELRLWMLRSRYSSLDDCTVLHGKARCLSWSACCKSSVAFNQLPTRDIFDWLSNLNNVITC